jgi:hypothetical protein
VTTLTDEKPVLPGGPSRPATPAAGTRPATLWDRAWEWLSRPTHYRAMRQLRFAIERQDSAPLELLLDPGVAVVIEGGDPQRLRDLVVVGAHDASALLMHGLRAHDGLRIDIRSVNGQAGLMLTDRGHAAAAIAVDFTGKRITMVWIRLHPYVLRHWNRV